MQEIPRRYTKYELLDKNYETIAIICKTSKEALDTYNSLKDEGIDMELITSDNKEYKGKLFVTTAALSKGLEFDSVIIKDASNNIYSINNKQDMHLLYVACTRALHELIILYNKKLCEVFGNEEELNIEKNNYLVLKR